MKKKFDLLGEVMNSYYFIFFDYCKEICSMFNKVILRVQWAILTLTIIIHLSVGDRNPVHQIFIQKLDGNTRFLSKIKLPEDILPGCLEMAVELK